MGKLIQNMLAHGVPEQFYLASLFRRSKAEAHHLRLQAQAIRGFGAAKQQPGFSRTRCCQELQAENGLAGARRAHNGGHAGRRKATVEQLVERGNSG